MSEKSDDPVVQGLDIYLVGGAVRDQLLGRKVTDRDWVVVGSTPQAMTERGFKPVGAEFPVFLHPETGEEFALARTERKTHTGHQGFEFFANPTVTLEEDLIRRDFTMNAIAQSPDGQLIDPFNGQVDLKNNRLHPVSDAFNEDPLRVIRAARFCAQMPFLRPSADLENRVKSMREELSSLSMERLWQEAYKAFSGDPETFFQTLTRWQCWTALSLEPPEIRAQIYRGSREANLAKWIWAHRDQPLPWLTRWKAPKRWQQLHQDLARFSQDRVFDVLKQAGALKNTPRAKLLISTLIQTGQLHEERVNAAVAAAQGIKANQMPSELRGPELGAALHTQQHAVFNQRLANGGS